MRMVSGTFPSLPYVCHYDTIDDILQCCSGIQTENKGDERYSLHVNFCKCDDINGGKKVF